MQRSARRRVALLALGAVVWSGFVSPATPAAAQEASASTDRPVPEIGAEVPTLRTANTKTFLTSEPGVYRTKSFAAPVHFQQADGSWQDIRTEWTSTADGLVNAANSFGAKVASVASAPLVATVSLGDGRSVGFGLAGALPVPVTTAGPNVARFAGVLPEVDLELTSMAQGVKEDVVLRSPAAANTFTFPLALEGLTAELNADGDVVYRDETGAVRGRTPKGVMVDSAGPEQGGEAVSGAVTYELLDVAGAKALKVVADRAWLDDPSRVWPVRVDPSYHTGGHGRSYRNNCWASFDPSPLRVGNARSCGDSHWRTGVYFPYESLYGKRLVGASVHIWNRTEGTANAYATGVSFLASWSWNCRGTDPQVVANGQNEQHFYNGRIYEIYNSGISSQVPGFALCFVGYEAGGVYTYKRFDAYELWLDWEEPNRRPNTPDYPAPANEQVIADNTPEISARGSDPDPQNVALRMHLYTEGGSYLGGKNGGWICNGCRDNYVHNTPLPDGRYFWDAWTYDGQADSPVVRNYFRIDTRTPPSPPQGVNATAGPRTATVYWSSPSSDGGAAVTGYTARPYFSDGRSAGAAKTCDANCRSAVFTDLADATSYYFTVTASNDKGESSPAQSNTVTTPPAATAPSQPTTAFATAGVRSSSVSWTPPATDGGSPVTGYLARLFTGGTQVHEVSCPADCRSAANTNLADGTQYHWTVAAVNAVGTGPAATSNTVRTATAPGAPASATATGGSKSVRLDWTPPADDGGAPIRYVVTLFRGNPSAAQPAGQVEVPGSQRSHQFGGLPDDTEFFGEVVARNDVGDSAVTRSNTTRTSPLVSVPPTTLPPTPTTLPPTPTTSTTQPPPPQPPAVSWGPDSVESISQSLLDRVKREAGTPDYWGRYLHDEGASSDRGLKADEIQRARENGIKLLVVDYNPGTDVLTGYESGRNFAAKAVRNAQRLAIPGTVALYADIEPAGANLPADIDKEWIKGWFDGITQGGYRVGYYGGPRNADFRDSFCAASGDNARIGQESAIWSYHNLVGRTRKENAPEYNPQSVPCGPQSMVWQYGQPGDEDDQLPRDLPIDTNLLKGEVYDRLWTP